MATADNASILRALYDALNAKELDKLAQYVTEDAQATNVPFDVKAGFRDDFERWNKAFPDGNMEVKTLVAGGDYVFSEIVGRGTHTGALAGPTGDIPATGRRVEMPMAEICRFSGGKIAEVRYYFDAFSLYRQLGLGVAPELGGEAPGATTSPQVQH